MELKPQQVAGCGEAPRAGPGLGGALARGAGRHDARGRGGRKETPRHLVGWREEDFDDFHGGF